MAELDEKFGRALVDRIDYLRKNLTDEEKYIYFCLESFIKIWAATTGGNFDINEHTGFFDSTNTYALRQIDSVFFKKYGLHIVTHAHQLKMTVDEWEKGLKPTQRNPPT